ncbi:MAG TPA: VTT domain-containing protein [Minicystis sp.]|nr:VTT domain-containing protein [Minicystis sp.]
MFDLLREFFTRVFHARELLEWGGYPVMMAVIFAETGLLIGFFLPGDSLLVTAGALVAGGYMDPLAVGPFSNLLVMNAALVAMAVLGDATGFWIGYRAGPRIFSREQSLLFRKDHLLATQRFYDRHGGKTIVLARFMPFARTFAPVVAGVGKMPYSRFALFNVAGGAGWVFSMSFLGYFLGKLIDAKNIERVVYLVIVLSLMPLVIGWMRTRKKTASA